MLDVMSVACGTICKAVEERLGIPVLSGMYEERTPELICLNRM